MTGVLSSLGLYGVMSYSVNQRAGEFGLRMALGARPGDVFRLVMGRGAVLVVVELTIGLGGALALARYLSANLYEVTPQDPTTLVVVSLVLAAVALTACVVPARRATRLDTMAAPRCE